MGTCDFSFIWIFFIFCIVNNFKIEAVKFFFFKKMYLFFIYFWLRWVFVPAHSLSLVVASGGHSSLWCMGLSLRWLLLLRSTGSRRAGFSIC